MKLRFRGSEQLAYHCPASLRMRTLAGPQAETDAMAVGTALHGLVAFAHALGDPQAAIEQLGDLPDWANDCVTDALASLQAICAGHPGYREHVEVTLRMGHRVGLPEQSWMGTADYLWVSPDGAHAVLADLKTGVMPVSAGSPQLMSYLVGALDLAPGLQRATAVIIQPRAPRRIDTLEVTRAEIDGFIERMADLVPIALGPGAPFQPGAHCAQCHALPSCPAGSDHTLDQFAGAAAVDWKPEAFTNERLAAVLAAGPLLEKFVEGARAEATTRLQAGQQLPGFVLGRRRTQRKWRDAQEFLEAAQELGLPMDAIAPRKPVTPAAALRIASAEQAETINALVVKPQGAPAVMPAALDETGAGLMDLQEVLPVLFSPNP